MGDPAPDLTIHLPMALRQRLGGLLHQGATDSSGLQALLAAAISEDLAASEREEALIALLAARFLARGDLAAQDEIFAAFRSGHVSGHIIYGQSTASGPGDTTEFLYRLVSLPEGVHKWAKEKFSARTAAVITVVVGLIDLGTFILRGDSIIYEELDSRAAFLEEATDTRGAMSTAERVGEYESAIITVRVGKSGGKESVYSVELPVLTRKATAGLIYEATNRRRHQDLGFSGQ